MASKFKHHVSLRILDSLKKVGQVSERAHISLPKEIVIGNSKEGRNIELLIPVKNIQRNETVLCNNANDITLATFENIPTDETISSIQQHVDKHKENVIFTINRDIFVKEVLNDMIHKPNAYGKLFDVVSHPLGKKVVVEYSSPNIAKPFHVGHLRSTIIGNFIAKLHEYLSCSVTKINYLGDWGTQFGMLKVGLDISNYTEEMIRQNPIQLLFEAYVKANKAAETDPEISARARRIFQQMEQGSLGDMEKWQAYRGYTVNELQNLYRRLGVEFTQYDWESMYGANDVKSVLNLLQGSNILKQKADGKQVVELSDKLQVPVMKSDGSTLYLVRDIAAAIDRYEKLEFDEMLYIVDNAQSDHFVALFGVLRKMAVPWANSLKHIKFGRVRGMSTRKGNVVFLKDILDETRSIMKRKQQESPTTKTNLLESTSDVLGISAIIINDLKQRRQRDYEFDWNKATQVQGDTGVRLQYTHCRLWSLEKNCRAVLPVECDPSVLQEPEVTLLVQEIARFEEVLRRSYAELEACILVNYLFQLCNLINRAFKVLPVKHEESHIASQRLMLFHSARLVLNQGMRILGLRPLQEM
ncbi:probable arginine--tRNA ligase, mitochondrial [Anabrus simplex]|uniref:probable arginine--tRNA ligase, mitochondrial n=1 Tax=Anabrus simplex TaxID=316456 RepID=UPI0035A30E3E